MSTTESLYYAAFLANFIEQFNRYVPIPLLCLGLVGNILNMLILSRPSLRSNPCSLYFISASLTNIVAIFDGLLARILLSFALDPSDTSDFFCKIKYYVIYSSSALSSWFIVFATIDRYFSSSRNVRTRQWSSIKRTRWLILGMVIFASIFFIDKLVCFVANIPNQALKCNAIIGSCRNYHDYSYIVVYSLAPCILMAIFGILTLMNIRKLGRNVGVQPQVQPKFDSRRRIRNTNARDLQLISMLIVQIIFLVLFSFPISIMRIYLGSTQSITKSRLRLTQETFAIQFIIMLTFIPNINTFYIYIITGKIFRKELRAMINSWLRKIGIRTSIVEPQRTTTIAIIAQQT